MADETLSVLSSTKTFNFLLKNASKLSMKKYTSLRMAHEYLSIFKKNNAKY